MKVFSICVVRDEYDVIEETITAALEWSDHIYILDNGSTDGTWELLKALAVWNPKLIIVGREPGLFRDEIRGDIFERYRSDATSGDWWCRLDADEFYIDDPRNFLSRVPRQFGFVRSATFNYYFTDRDLAAYELNPDDWLARPVQDRLRYYENNWSEGRFVRHRNDLRWAGNIWPPNRGRIHRGRIRLKHFQYRSPEQITRRLSIRQPQSNVFQHEAGRAMATPVPGANHRWVEEWLRQSYREKATWRDRIRSANSCRYDAGDGQLVLRDELMPRLPHPALDILRASLQASQIGNWVLKPYMAWRDRRKQTPIRKL